MGRYTNVPDPGTCGLCGDSKVIITVPDPTGTYQILQCVRCDTVGGRRAA